MDPYNTADDQNWQPVFDQGDERAYRKLVEPLMNELIPAAKRRIQFFIHQGLLQRNDLTPEEVVGETLIRAWDRRDGRPENISLRGWLLGAMFRTIQEMVDEDHEYRDGKALSLDEDFQTAGDTGAVQEEASEFVYADDAPNWQEMIPGTQPVDYELPLTGDVRNVVSPTEADHVMMLHDEFDMPLDEVAYVLDRTLESTQAMLEEARASVRESFQPPFPDERDAQTP